MQENAKVFVFEKKEIFLIFVFVVIMSVTCFTLGVNLGKKLALDKGGVTAKDIAEVEMKSAIEEDVDKTAAEPAVSDEEKLKGLMDDSKEKLNQELKEFASDEEKTVAEPAPVEDAKPEISVPATKLAAPVTTASKYAGKYTIQLGSYGSMEEAKQFAEGFTVRGYNPIVNEVIIPEKGTWYRVSLGVFDTVAATKEYIKKEATLFEGQQYTVMEIK